MPYFPLPKKILSIIYNKYQDFIIFETTKFNNQNFYSYIFTKPFKTLYIYNIQQTKNLLKRIDFWLKKNFYVAGFFSYEFGYGLDYISKKKLKKKFDFPLAFFNVYKDVSIFNHKIGKFIKYNLCTKKEVEDKNYIQQFEIKNLKLNIDFAKYKKNLEKIKKYIIAGDTYQVNYTMKYKFDFNGSELALFNKLKQNQKVEYCSFIKNNYFSILSFSPELFFKIKNDTITVKPMKGTIEYNKKQKNFLLKKQLLSNNVKNLSENLMIVDLLRNDLGKISKTASVRVKKIFQIEKFKTLLQMTSTIEAKLKSNISITKLFNSIFPSGSVTGAPKIRTMEIIHELEKEPRGVYTGAIGFFTPKKYSIFNVAIRTIFIKNNKGELGVGSGIVYDSDIKKEFDECKLKAKFFTKLKNEIS